MYILSDVNDNDITNEVGINIERYMDDFAI